MREQQTTPSPFQGEGRGEGQHPRNLTDTGLAKHLRKRQTDAEKQLWHHLRNRHFVGFKFRRQYPIGGYVVDFICVQHKLIIELDGGQHVMNRQHDSMRDTWLHAHGYRVLRFWNNEWMMNRNGVLETILSHLINPHPNPLPDRERECIERRDR